MTGSGFKPAGELNRAGAVREVEPGSPLASLLTAAALCNDAVLVPPENSDQEWSIVGDPTEGALLAASSKLGFDRERVNERFPRTAEIPFDSDRKRMVTIHRTEDPDVRIVTAKGAVEAMIQAVTAVASEDGEVELDERTRAIVLDQAAEFAADGYRVLALAGRTVHDGAISQRARVRAGPRAVRPRRHGRPATRGVTPGRRCLSQARASPRS